MHLKDLGNLNVFLKLLNNIGGNTDTIDFFNKADLATQKFIINSGKLNSIQFRRNKNDR